ncbi:MAG: hypothetical protein AAFV07_18380, partial [Bacteroidota bacterium]
MYIRTLVACCLLYIYLFPGNDGGLYAAIQLPSIIGDHMVLQQQAFPALWGRARPGEQIVVVPGWDQNAPTVAYADSKGRWRIPVATPAAGGPYEILIQGNENRILLRDVWIGEVWILGGGRPFLQKNREAPEPSSQFAFSPEIRFFSVGIDHASTLRSDVGGSWNTLNNQARLDSLSALGVQMALTLHDSLEVPVGIIEATQ